MNDRHNILNTTFVRTLAAALLLTVVSCVQESELETDSGNVMSKEMVQFAAGTTANRVGTKANGNDGISTTTGTTYYMPDRYRFVCRMYYMAETGSDKFDVTGGTDYTVWMKVRGNYGNSLYWRNTYPELDWNLKANFDDYGNDVEANCLYWQNRKPHAFLAWTDLNRATEIGYVPDRNSGSLKFEPADVDYVKNTGDMAEQWKIEEYEIFTGGMDNPEYTGWDEVIEYVRANYDTEIKGKVPEGVNPDALGRYHYISGGQCKYTYSCAVAEMLPDGGHRKFGWIQCNIFNERLEYTGDKTAYRVIRIDGKPAYLFDDEANRYVAIIEGEGDEDPQTWKYYATDQYGNVKYDETKSCYTFYLKCLEKWELKEIVKNLPANAWNLTRKCAPNRISEQPDICVALTKQAPLGATQSANRVNLYFKHQFSQVQVNIKTSSDLSVVIKKEHIKKVELLGVSEKGYVFTTLNDDGELESSTYESVDISNYTDEHLAKNQWGTAFEMFDMIDEEAGEDKNWGYPAGYLKSFNAIAFGQLQAIRISWVEAENDIVHQSTYRVANEDLKNLKSGHKYIWNMELRRGTLAIVRTEIQDWIVPANGLEYKTSGYIIVPTAQ